MDIGKKSQGKKCDIVPCALKKVFGRNSSFLNNMTVSCAKVCDEHSVDWIQTNAIDKRIFEILHCIYRQKLSCNVSEFLYVSDKTALKRDYGLITETKGNGGERKNRRNVSQ